MERTHRWPSFCSISSTTSSSASSSLTSSSSSSSSSSILVLFLSIIHIAPRYTCHNLLRGVPVAPPRPPNFAVYGQVSELGLVSFQAHALIWHAFALCEAPRRRQFHNLGNHSLSGRNRRSPTPEGNLTERSSEAMLLRCRAASIGHVSNTSVKRAGRGLARLVARPTPKTPLSQCTWVRH